MFRFGLTILVSLMATGCTGSSDNSMSVANKQTGSDVVLTSVENLEAWLESDDPELVATIVADMRRHVEAVRSEGGEFYGYSVLPDDYRTQPNAAGIRVAFNRESDIAPDNVTDDYFRYCVNEWENYVDEGFEATNSKMQSLLNQFRSAHSRDPDSFFLDDYELAFIVKNNRAILNAMAELKNSGVFEDDTYLVIWFFDADYEIMDESAKTLNSSDVYKRYASQFK